MFLVNDVLCSQRLGAVRGSGKSADNGPCSGSISYGCVKAKYRLDKVPFLVSVKQEHRAIASKARRLRNHTLFASTSYLLVDLKRLKFQHRYVMSERSTYQP